VSDVDQVELLSSLARVVGFFAAASPDPRQFIASFGLEMIQALHGFSDPDHPNHPGKVFAHVFSSNPESKH
jgi:hypothetical protein